MPGGRVCTWRMFNSCLLGTYSEPKPLPGPWSYRDVPLQRVYCLVEKASMKPYPWVTRRQQMVSLSLGPADSYGLFSPISNSAQACLDPNMKQGVAGRCVLGSGRDSHHLPLLPVTPSGQGLVRKTPHLIPQNPGYSVHVGPNHTQQRTLLPSPLPGPIFGRFSCLLSLPPF